MEKTTPRRSFLGKSLKATASLALLSSTSTLRAFAPKEDSSGMTKTDLRTKYLSKYVSVTGKIFDTDGKAPLKNVALTISHLSSDSKVNEHKGAMHTDADGNYHFLIDLPHRAYGKPYKLHFEILKNGASYTTELSFNKFGAYISGKHWEENRLLDDNLLFPQHQTFLNKSTIHFNILFNN